MYECAATGHGVGASLALKRMMGRLFGLKMPMRRRLFNSYAEI
jgi:hypothetical protein